MQLRITLAALSLVAASLTSCQSSDQSVNWVDYGDNPMENPQFMEDMMSSGAPSAEHMRLAKFAGTWQVEGKFWMEPDGDPMVTEGTSTTRMVLGGRYMLEEYTSDFMGEPFNGMLIQGFDNVRQQNFTIWIDNMSTFPSIATGTRDANGVLHTTSNHHDIRTPDGRTLRTVITEKGDDEIVMQMYDTSPEGDEFMSMQMTYTR